MTPEDELAIVRIQLDQERELTKQLNVIINKQDVVIETYKNLLDGLTKGSTDAQLQ